MEDLVQRYIRQRKIAAGLNRQRIAEAWDTVSGAAAFTLERRYFRGTLYVSLSSSMVRYQLDLQRDSLRQRINDFLRADALFVPDDPAVGLVRDLVLK